MAGSCFTNSRRRRRIRLRSVAVPFFLVTVNPTLTGPLSSRRRRCTTKAAVAVRAPLATARKSARCLSRSMNKVSLRRGPALGTQALAATGAARGENLAASGGREAGTEAMAALAHQFARLIGPLHGSFSADNLSARATICLINEICPLTLAGPKAGHFRLQNEPVRRWPDRREQLARLIREGPGFVNVAGYAGSRMSNPLRLVDLPSLKRRIRRANNSILAVYYLKKDGAAFAAFRNGGLAGLPQSREPAISCRFCYESLI